MLVTPDPELTTNDPIMLSFVIPDLSEALSFHSCIHW